MLIKAWLKYLLALSIAIGALAFLISMKADSATLAQGNTTYVRQVRVLDTDDLGVQHPTGLAFSPGTPAFTGTAGDSLTAFDPATIDILNADPEVFVGAGDIADCGSDEDEATAQLLDNIPGTVFTLGDNAYPDGTDDDFNNCYEPTWGRHKARTYPALGDNEYNASPVAAGHFNYFGAVAGDPTEGYYSYDVGSWHIIVLNSNCSKIGGCGPSDPQGLWRMSRQID